MAKLMAIVINAGGLTRYVSFTPIQVPSSSYFEQFVLTGCFDHGGVQTIVLCILYLSLSLKFAAMPRNFVFLSIQFLFPKCMTKAFFTDEADQ